MIERNPPNSSSGSSNPYVVAFGSLALGSLAFGSLAFVLT